MGSPVEVGGSPRRAFLFGTGRAARAVPIGSITGLAGDGQKIKKSEKK